MGQYRPLNGADVEIVREQPLKGVHVYTGPAAACKRFGTRLIKIHRSRVLGGTEIGLTLRRVVVRDRDDCTAGGN